MKYLIVLVGLWAGNCWAGWYGELGVSAELGDEILQSKSRPACLQCNNDDTVFHSTVGYQFKLKPLKGKLFSEIEHKSFLNNRDENNGFTTVTIGVRWGN